MDVVGLVSVDMSSAIKRAQKHKADIKILSKAGSKVRQTILEEAPDSLVLCICDCAKSILKGEIPLSEEKVEQLRRHQSAIRQIAEPARATSKRALLLQGGGPIERGLSAVLRAAARSRGRRSSLARLGRKLRHFPNPLEKLKEEIQIHNPLGNFKREIRKLL